MTTAAPDAPGLNETLAELQMTRLHLEELTEATADATRMLNAEDAGWRSMSAAEGIVDRDYIVRQSKLARVMALVDPLIRRGVNLRTAYVWGAGVEISADDGTDEAAGQVGQDVNAVLQEFLEDPSNQATFSSGEAHSRMERSLATDGERFFALFTTPETGRVEVRSLPVAQIADIISNPEDDSEPWYYKRTYTRRSIKTTPGAGATTATESRTVYYPAVGYRPGAKPSMVNGSPVEWNTPVVHVAVNVQDGTLRGTPDVLAALPWAQGFRSFLEDWARLTKAYSRIAWQVTGANSRSAASARAQYGTTHADVEGPVGQMAMMGEGQKLEAVGKSGATIDARSGFPLAAMVAAALDVPATILTADPGVTGARATAETLDHPMELVIRMRRDLWADVLRTVCSYVIDCAVRAGRLRGTRLLDRYTQVERVKLAGEQDRSVQVDFPDVSKTPLKDQMDALKIADELDKLPPELLARLAMAALGVDDVDAYLDDMKDEEGNFIPPSTLVAGAAGNAAADAFRRGEDPAAVL